VASQLCRRGTYAQITLGHHKRADILLETGAGMVRLQVKAKQGREWPSVQGICGPDDFLVLADYRQIAIGSPPSVFVLNVDDWKQVIDAHRKKNPSFNVSEDLRIEHNDGWRGLNLKIEDVEEFRDAWDKVLEKLGVRAQSETQNERD